MKITKTKEVKNRINVTSGKTNSITDKSNNNIIQNQRKIFIPKNQYNILVSQLKGDKYYWIRVSNGIWTYVGTFKNHAEANEGWKINKIHYSIGNKFSQVSTKKKFK